MRLIRVGMISLALALAAANIHAVQPTQGGQKPQPAQDGFLPMDEVPPEEQLPAAPMVVAAYSFVWVAFLVYVFTLLRRVRHVEADLAALERRERR
jgi:CcmD family protein